MAEPLKIIRRLNEVTTDYAVFERDQVLTEKQLNSVVEYLDDQSRLTRTQLLGVGIVGGLWPTVGKTQIVIAKGVGVTSDGDLLGLPADKVFDRYIAYDEAAPAYEPFYVDGQRLPLIELLADDDKRDGQPLADLAGSLEKLLLVAFMESYENDPDLCTGGDCDNKGRTARNTQRLLLVDREIGQKIGLTAGLTRGSDLARRLSRARVARVDFGTGTDTKVDVTSAEKFVKRYRDAAGASFGNLRKALAPLVDWVAAGRAPGLPDPSGWGADIDQRVLDLEKTVAGVQYLYAHAKDLIAVWNDLREALFADDGLLCPSADAFPKHLLLGALADPSIDRTACYPSPWLAGGTVERQRVIMLMRRMTALLKAFELPKATYPKIMPSRRETSVLDERAIPIYYQPVAAVRELWNETRRQRGESVDNVGYHWTQATDLQPYLNLPTRAELGLPDPFVDDVAGNDFFRIEGFLGLQANVAEAAIEKLARQRNLPIAVMSALSHNERQWIIRGPKFRKTSLHSLHYLLRQDLTSHLKDNIAYSKRLSDEVTVAQGKWALDEEKKFKLGGTFTPQPSLDIDYTKPLKDVKAKLEKADEDLTGSDDKPGPLAVRTYKAFVAQSTPLRERVSSMMVSAAQAKVDIGAVARNDVVSPFDAFAGSKTHLWVDWLGDILKKREDDQKDKLMLTNLLREHPGLEHAGGVVPGGTFVLVYNDSGAVIGDLMLPYWIDDNDESHLDEPVLKQPDIDLRLPVGLLPVKVIKPFEVHLDDFKVTRIAPEIKLQENYSNFFRSSLGTLGDVLKNTKNVTVADPKAGVAAATGDNALGTMLATVKGQQEQVVGLKTIADDDRLPAATREKLKEQIKQMEEQLAVTVSTTVDYFAVAAPETVRFEANKAVVYETLGNAMKEVTDQAATSKLQTNLKETSVAANKLTTGSSALVFNQVMTNAGMRIG